MMSVTTLELTAHDPIIARDGRPFGAGQGNRMRSLSWPLPSVVAGSFRTALVKANPRLDFTGEMPQKLMKVEVAGPFPKKNGELYLPAPNDCVWEETSGKVFRVSPVPLQEGEGVDFPVNSLAPVRLTDEQAQGEFKAKAVPAWWPLKKYEEWLTTADAALPDTWFDTDFLKAATREVRDHVCLSAETGAAAEGQIFATEGLNVAHLRKFLGHESTQEKKSNKFADRYAEIVLSVRVTTAEMEFEHVKNLGAWHPLGGERRLVHWQRSDGVVSWRCPDKVKSVLESASRLRMVLATPAIFRAGWRPGWLDAVTLIGPPFAGGPELKLVGVTNPRWKAVSGWSLAALDGQPRGPKPIRRMVPAGSVYFFEVKKLGDAALLADAWLQSVSDEEQERRDGFGLAVWGRW